MDKKYIVWSLINGSVCNCLPFGDARRMAESNAKNNPGVRFNVSVQVCSVVATEPELLWTESAKASTLADNNPPVLHPQEEARIEKARVDLEQETEALLFNLFGNILGKFDPKKDGNGAGTHPAETPKHEYVEFTKPQIMILLSAIEQGGRESIKIPVDMLRGDGK